MPFLDKNYWSQKYKDESTGWDIGHCSNPLKNYFDQITDQSIHVLIPGCGNAHEAIYLWENGFQNVSILDFSQTVLDKFKTEHPYFPQNQIICEDFFNHNKTYDLIIEQTFFCALSPALRKDYTLKINELLNPQGKLVGVLFNREFEKGPPFGGNIDEYQFLFDEQYIIRRLAPCNNSIPERSGNELFIILEKK